MSKLITFKRYIKVYKKPKIFGIGLNKTGTTSLKTAMSNLGYIVGSQRKAKKFIYDWDRKDFDQILKYCYSAQFFQDIPFSLPYTFIPLDHKFSNSKFILTIRNDSEEWYRSVVSYHSKKWGMVEDDQDEVNLKDKSWAWDVLRMACNINENDPYNKELLINYYEKHNEMVIDYFKNRPQDLLILNPSEADALEKLCTFLGVKFSGEKFPHENPTKDLKK